MTLQEIFDTVAERLHAQGKASMDFTERCVYHSPCGARCAVGWLIPDSHYNPAIEGDEASSDRVLAVLKQAGIDADEATVDLLIDLQAAHDDGLTTSMENWTQRMQYIATERGLLLPAVLRPAK